MEVTDLNNTLMKHELLACSSRAAQAQLICKIYLPIQLQCSMFVAEAFGIKPHSSSHRVASPINHQVVNQLVFGEFPAVQTSVGAVSVLKSRSPGGKFLYDIGEKSCWRIRESDTWECSKNNYIFCVCTGHKNIGENL